MVKENLTFGQEAGASSSSSMHMQARGNAGAPATGRSEMINQAVNHSRGLMSDQYKAMWSDAAVASSSTVSSHEGSSARASVSPELQQHVLAHSSANPRFSADDRYCDNSVLVTFPQNFLSAAAWRRLERERNPPRLAWFNSPNLPSVGFVIQEGLRRAP